MNEGNNRTEDEDIMANAISVQLMLADIRSELEQIQFPFLCKKVMPIVVQAMQKSSKLTAQISALKAQCFEHSSLIPDLEQRAMQSELDALKFYKKINSLEDRLLEATSVISKQEVRHQQQETQHDETIKNLLMQTMTTENRLNLRVSRLEKDKKMMEVEVSEMKKLLASKEKEPYARNIPQSHYNRSSMVEGQNIVTSFLVRDTKSDAKVVDEPIDEGSMFSFSTSSLSSEESSVSEDDSHEEFDVVSTRKDHDITTTNTNACESFDTREVVSQPSGESDLRNHLESLEGAQAALERNSGETYPEQEKTVDLTRSTQYRDSLNHKPHTKTLVSNILREQQSNPGSCTKKQLDAKWQSSIKARAVPSGDKENSYDDILRDLNIPQNRDDGDVLKNETFPMSISVGGRRKMDTSVSGDTYSALTFESMTTFDNMALGEI